MNAELIFQMQMNKPNVWRFMWQSWAVHDLAPKRDIEWF